MFGKVGINKETSEKIDETRKDIKEQIHNLMESGQAVSVGILVAGCLTVGYILGAVTTGAMYRTMEVVRRR